MKGIEDENLILNGYSVDGRQIVKNIFKAATEISLPKGSYVVVVNNQTGLNVRKKVVVY